MPQEARGIVAWDHAAGLNALVARTGTMRLHIMDRDEELQQQFLTYNACLENKDFTFDQFMSL